MPRWVSSYTDGMAGMDPRALTRTTRGRIGLICAVAAVAAGSVAAVVVPGGRPPGTLAMAGIAADPCDAQHVLVVPPGQAGRFEAGSSVLLPDGKTAALSSTCAAASVITSASATAAATTSATAVAVAASKAWLATGDVPGGTRADRALATRALLDLRLSVLPGGAVVAGYHPGWNYAWPRDSSWVAVALADTGHSGQALSILRFLQRAQSADGTWAARYLTDGSGPVRDGRPSELERGRLGALGRLVLGRDPAAHPGQPGAAGSARVVADGRPRGRRGRRLADR